jgi:hypothetical protein
MGTQKPWRRGTNPRGGGPDISRRPSVAAGGAPDVSFAADGHPVHPASASGAPRGRGSRCALCFICPIPMPMASLMADGTDGQHSRSPQPAARSQGRATSSAPCHIASDSQPSTRHCFTYICPPNGPIQRPNPVRYVQYECYETTARSEKHENWPVCDPRAAPPEEYMALKVVKMGT